jgi:hypothetical protein
MDVNVKYKNSVFTALFSNPDVLRELYGALTGDPPPPDVPITINTLEGVLFMDQLNDVSFTIGVKQLILAEHQSTISPNITIRILIYMARLYEKILKGVNIYGTKLIKIPLPECYVLYNGRADYPEEDVLKLSASFEDVVTSSGVKKSPIMDLEVKVININAGKNSEMVQKSQTLWEYSSFIGKVRENEREGKSLDESIVLAINYCIQHNILR